MFMLVDKLRTDLLAARKARNVLATNLLSTLVGETVMVGKNVGNRETTDDEALAMVRKFLKNATETLQKLVEAGRSVDNVKEEIAILNSYLPKQLTDEELFAVVREMKVADPTLNLGGAMKLLKEKYNGLYDGKIAGGIVKTVLTVG